MEKARQQMAQGEPVSNSNDVSLQRSDTMTSEKSDASPGATGIQKIPSINV